MATKMKTILCPECDGKGHIARKEYTDNGDGTATVTVWNESCPTCKGWGNIEVPMTKADEIRAMNDEDLAEQFAIVMVAGMEAITEIFNLPCPDRISMIANAKLKVQRMLAESVEED